MLVHTLLRMLTPLQFRPRRGCHQVLMQKFQLQLHRVKWLEAVAQHQAQGQILEWHKLKVRLVDLRTYNWTWWHWRRGQTFAFLWIWRQFASWWCGSTNTGFICWRCAGWHANRRYDESSESQQTRWFWWYQSFRCHTQYRALGHWTWHPSSLRWCWCFDSAWVELGWRPLQGGAP